MPRFAPYGYNRHGLHITIPFTTYLSTVGQVNLLLSKAFPYGFEIEKVEIFPTVVGTGAGASRLINIRKGSATGAIVASVTATLANQGTLGVVTVGAVVTAAAANKFNDQGAVPDTLTIELPATGTVFATGQVELLITLRHLAQKAV